MHIIVDDFAKNMQALFAFISVETSVQLPHTSFITEPQSPVFAKPNTTAEITWKMTNCILNSDWRVKVVTKCYDLYPLQNGLIRNITDYNATANCEGNFTVIVLTIIFNENVLENAGYVVCKVRRLKGDKIMLRSMVNFTTTVTPPNTSPSITTTLNSGSAIKIELTRIETTTGTGSGCRQCVHFVLWFLLLIFFVVI